MLRELHLLKRSHLPGEIEIHTDLLSTVPSALSRKRALKTGREKQKEMDDPEPEKCILCDPDQKSAGSSETKVLIENRAAHFANDFPYLPGDQQVVFLWHDDPAVRRRSLHRVKLIDFGRSELFWLTKACIELGRRYDAPDRTYDLMRMVVGFNLGRLAGQSIPHFHLQYGWEVVLNKRSISEKALDLYFEELAASDLIIYEDERIKIIAPWTPQGQYALDMYFNRKYEISQMDHTDLRTLAVVGAEIIKKYLSLGIQNVNIVFTNSPQGRKIEPLVVHFVPRVNMPAMYEIKGVNVVDTPPQKIAEEFRRYGPDGEEGVNWVELVAAVGEYDPDTTFELELETETRRKIAVAEMAVIDDAGGPRR